MIETKKRTFVKMVTYRLIAWGMTIGITFLFTGKLAESAGFASLLHLILSIDYYIHERVWNRIKWGTL